MDILEKVGFLKGLVEASDLSLGDKERKVFDALLELVDDMAHILKECDDDITDLYDEVDAMDEHLADIDDDLDTLFGVEEDDDEDEDEDEEDYLYDIECPSCGKGFSVDEDTIFNGDVKCPFCGEKIEFDIQECDCEDCDDECDDEDCDCGHHHHHHHHEEHED